MNLLLLDGQEPGLDAAPDGAERVEIRDGRVRHMRKVLRLVPGDALRVGRVDGPLGRGTVEILERDRAVLRLVWEGPPRPPSPNVLVLAVARPPMLRRAVFQAVSIGVRRIHLIRSARVEKSYFDASLFRDGGLDEAIHLGLEQAVDTRRPALFVHDRFRPFVEDVLPGELIEPETLGLLAHPGDHPTLAASLPPGHEGTALLAIGPEGGWIPFEVELFEKAGLGLFSMGARILRVDTAVPALLGQIEALRSLPTRP